VHAVAFSPDGALLASAGWDHDLRLWSMKTFQPVRVFPRAAGPLKVLAFVPNRAHLVCGGWNELVVYRYRADKKFALPETGWARSIAYAPNGKLFAMASSYAAPVLWDVDGDKFTARARTHYGHVHQVTFSADSKWLVYGGDGQIVVRDLSSGKTVHTLPHPDQLLALSPDKKWLAALHKNDTVILWNLAKGNIEREFKGQPVYGYGAAAFSPDSKLLAFTFTGMYGKRDFSLQLWDLTTLKELGPLTGHRGEAACVAFSPDGKLLASGGVDTTILVWDVARLRKKP
jgi:WD40 repeat protein